MKEPIQTPETVGSLRVEVLELKTKIFRQNLTNHINKLTPPLRNNITIDEVLIEMPQVVITQANLSGEEINNLPFAREHYGNSFDKLIIYPEGLFGDGQGSIIYNYPDDFISVLQPVAFAKKQEFRELAENLIGIVQKSGDDENWDKYYEQCESWVKAHEFELLKELKVDMEAALARISNPEASS
jgi:hypothetical protein